MTSFALALVLVTLIVCATRLLEQRCAGVDSVLVVDPEPESAERVVEQQPSLLEGLLRGRVIVTLKSGEAFDGVLFAVDDRAWTLRSASLVGSPAQTKVGVDGELVLLVETVAFLQRP